MSLILSLIGGGKSLTWKIYAAWPMIWIGETDILRGDTDNADQRRPDGDRDPDLSRFPACRDSWSDRSLRRGEQDLAPDRRGRRPHSLRCHLATDCARRAE